MNFYELDDLEILENKTREVALNLVCEMLGQDDDFKNYWHFRMDVAAIVLNNLPPCYTVSDMEKLPLFDKVSIDEIRDIIKDAAKVVRERPHHIVKKKKSKS